jgi:hypothetical protein
VGVAGELKWVELLSTALFTLWALYISLVEHPARLASDARAGQAQFRESYRRAAPWQVSAAAIALLSGVFTSIATREWTWGIAGVMVGVAIPFTLIVIMPTNRTLLRAATSQSETASLLRRWGRLHWIRTLLGLAALAVLSTRLRVM